MISNRQALFDILVYNMYNDFEKEEIVEWVEQIIAKIEAIDINLIKAAQQDLENDYRSITDAQEDVLGSINYPALEDELWNIWKNRWDLIEQENKLKRAKEQMSYIEMEYINFLYKKQEE